MKQATEIKATAIFRVIGQPCWGVPSDDARRAHPYKVCWNEETGLWECECRDGQFAAGRGQSANCKHVRAVMTSVLANKAQAEKPAVAREARGSMRREIKMEGSVPMR
ncbi:MAG TPA: SWIM zinc finger family protein [Ktedonobacteraceae bacterium]|nr:SWIM zinc finger family protein [Ktedonobacteraceae bacterium]